MYIKILVCLQYNLSVLIKRLCQLSKHIYFCEIVYFKTFLKQKKMSIWPKLLILNLINKDNFAFKYQLNKDKVPCSVKTVKVTNNTI